MVTVVVLALVGVAVVGGAVAGVAVVGVAILLLRLGSLVTTICPAAVASLMSAMGAVVVDWRVLVLVGVCAVCVGVDVNGRRGLSNDAASG